MELFHFAGELLKLYLHCRQRTSLSIKEKSKQWLVQMVKMSAGTCTLVLLTCEVIFLPIYLANIYSDNNLVGFRSHQKGQAFAQEIALEIIFHL